MKLSSFLFFLSFIFLVVVGCSRDAAQDAPSESSGANSPLVIYNWEEYLGSDTVANFTEETGIKVKEVFFGDEEEMLGALQSGAGEFDLVVCSDDAVREMVQAKMLAPIDFDQIPNFEHVSSDFTNQPWDPDQLYSIPYLWGTTGIVVNSEFVGDEADSYAILFDAKIEGKIAMLNNPWEVTAAAAKYLGYSINADQEGQWLEIAAAMLDQRSLVHGYYDAITIQQMLIEEEIYVGQIFSGEGLSAVDENEHLRFFIPKEGAPQWLDVFVIPKTASHVSEAHRFLNYVLEPEVNATIASEYWYATANQTAEQFMDPEVLGDPSVYPSDAVRRNLEFFHDVGDLARIVNRTWAQVQLSE